MATVQQIRERDVQKCITDYLSAEGIWWTRQNSGAMSAEHNGKRRFFRFGQKGMADLLCSPKIRRFFPWGALRMTMIDGTDARVPVYLWIEVKKPGGRQSPDQLRFELECLQRGHAYLLAESVDDVEAWLLERV